MKAIIQILIVAAIASNSFSQVSYDRSDRGLDELNAELKGDVFEYNSLINEGIARDEGKDYKGAIELYSQAIDLLPDNPKAYDMRGVSYLKLLKLSQSL